MAAKKRQYHIYQYTLSDLEEIEGKLTVKLSADNLVNSSETLMYYILNKTDRKRLLFMMRRSQ